MELVERVSTPERLREAGPAVEAVGEKSEHGSWPVNEKRPRL